LIRSRMLKSPHICPLRTQCNLECWHRNQSSTFLAHKECTHFHCSNLGCLNVFREGKQCSPIRSKSHGCCSTFRQRMQCRQSRQQLRLNRNTFPRCKGCKLRSLCPPLRSTRNLERMECTHQPIPESMPIFQQRMVDTLRWCRRLLCSNVGHWCS
jgi:hypothetical protein